MRNTIQIACKRDGKRSTITIDADLAKLMQIKLGDQDIRTWVRDKLRTGAVTDSRSTKILIYKEIINPAINL